MHDDVNKRTRFFVCPRNLSFLGFNGNTYQLLHREMVQKHISFGDQEVFVFKL